MLFVRLKKRLGKTEEALQTDSFHQFVSSLGLKESHSPHQLSKAERQDTLDRLLPVCHTEKQTTTLTSSSKFRLGSPKCGRNLGKPKKTPAGSPQHANSTQKDLQMIRGHPRTFLLWGDVKYRTNKLPKAPLKSILHWLACVWFRM